MAPPRRRTVPIPTTTTTLAFLLLLLLLLAAPTTTTAQAACFFPNGTDRNALEPSSPYRPCTLTLTTGPDAASMCCRTRSWDICRADGLCQAGNVTWRESCTDATWKAAGCLQLCVDGAMAGQDVPVVQCGDDSWCCDDGGGGGRRCCERGQGRWIGAGGAVVGTRPGGSTVGGAARSSSAAAAASGSSTSGGSGSGSSNTGAIVGGVVGGVGGAVVIVAAAFFLLRSRRRRARNDADVDTKSPQREPLQGQGGDGILEMEEQGGKDAAAMGQYPTPEPIYEAASSQEPARHELDAGHRRDGVRRW